MDNFLKISKKMFDLQGMDISKKNIRPILFKNPDYPNISSLISVFAYYGVESKLGKINLKGLVKQVDYFYAFLVDEGFVIVSKINEQTIEYYSTQAGWVSTDLKLFEKKWSGVILLMDFSKCTLAKKTGVFRNTWGLEIKQVIFIISFALILVIGVGVKEEILWLWLMLKITGIILGLLLLKMRVDSDVSLKVCSLNRYIDCRKIITSEYSLRFRGWDLIDISLIYFVISFILMFFSFISEDKNLIHTLGFISLTALAVIPFSLYYQLVKIKKLCSLCLGVILILLSEAIISFQILDSVPVFTEFPETIALLVSVALFIIISWDFLKIKIKENFEYSEISYKYHRIKHHKSVFQELQASEKSFNLDFMGNDIIFKSDGNKELITLVINPFCEFCGKELKAFRSLQRKSESWQLNLVFTESPNNYIALLFIENFNRLNEEDFLDHLEEWFRDRSEEKLKENLNFEISESAEIIFKNHLKWCRMNNILQTPLVLFNGRELSDYYSIEDLELFHSHKSLLI